MKIKDDDELLDKVDRLTSLIEQILLAYQTGDDQRLRAFHKEASKLGFDITNYLQETLG